MPAEKRSLGGIILPEQTAPTTPPAGHVAIYAKDGGVLYAKDDAGVEKELGGGGGSSWPVGSIVLFGGTVAPQGWMLCKLGNPPSDMTGVLLKTEYPDLFDVIGLAYTPFIVQGLYPDYFGLPDLTGRVGVGSAQGWNMGDEGGSATVVLTTDQLPSHSHSNGTLTAAANGNHNHGGYTGYTTPSVSQGFGGSTAGFTTGFGANGSSTANQTQHRHSIGNSGTHTHDVTGTTSTTGFGDAHQNMPPYLIVNHIIRVLP